MPVVTLQMKPITVQAVQYTGDNVHEINQTMLGRKASGNTPCVRDYPGTQAYPAVYQDENVTAEVWNHLLGQWLPLRPGEWVLHGASGEFSPAPADVVAATSDVIA
ncbi:hypothetical protein [Nocardia sp. NPDC051570]|uniref:hypothetical protein n=1 Tax=Nocardia sp. NPDC051570 TaxID=3364324 RepID=UPI0037AC6FB4